MADTQLYNELKKIARRRGYTMVDLVGKIGMSENGLKYAVEQHTLKISAIQQLVKILDIEVDFFFNGSNNESALQ